MGWNTVRKYIFPLVLTTVLLLSFAACGRNYAAGDNTTENTLNPFTSPLLEYFADGIEAGEYNGFEVGTSDTIAVLVDIDGSDTQGVLAARFVEDSEWGAVPVARVFYLVDGELLYMDIENHETDLLTIAVTMDGRLVQSIGMSRFNWSYTLFGILDGRLQPTLTLFVEGWAIDTDDPEQNAYLHHGGWQDGFESGNPITQEEYAEIVARYRLDDSFNSLWGMSDETDKILSMTFQTGVASEETSHSTLTGRWELIEISGMSDDEFQAQAEQYGVMEIDLAYDGAGTFYNGDWANPEIIFEGSLVRSFTWHEQEGLLYADFGGNRGEYALEFQLYDSYLTIFPLWDTLVFRRMD